MAVLLKETSNALKILSGGKGILAADESTGTMTKRLQSVKVPSNEENSMRIENRISGSDTNPYLIFAANLAAGYLGLKNKIKPSDETKKSVFYDKKSSLPKNMEEAILLFEKDEQISEVFSQKFVRTIAAIRRVEYQAYLKVISSWEREYLLLNV